MKKVSVVLCIISVVLCVPIKKLREYHRLTGLLLMITILFFTGCKSSRKTSSSKSSDKVPVTFDANDKSASSSRSSSTTKTTASADASANYPAREYYGDKWNTEHVRINSDQVPSGTTTLSINGKFVMPVCGKVLSEFGPRSGRMHTGIDIKVEKEDPVYCAFDGMVRMAKDYGSYGKMVVVRHENGLETLYSHLNSIAVKQNQWVKAGERIGGGGKTGNAQGEHLHFETRFQGEPFNPRLVVDIERCRLETSTLTLNNNSYKQYYKNLQVAQTKPAPKPVAEKKPAMQVSVDSPKIASVQPEKIPDKPVIVPANPADTADKPVQIATDTAMKQDKTVSIKHTVEKGDTLYNISRRYGTTVDSLRRLNNLAESAVIEIGQVLVVK